MHILAIDHFVITTKDVEACLRFIRKRWVWRKKKRMRVFLSDFFTEDYYTGIRYGENGVSYYS